jgi:aspartyl-tRNA(Asn)/glutamyl-tRNA(Gln) amidotransferase subunit B
LNYRTAELKETKLNSKIMVELLTLLQNKEITENVGKKLVERIIDSGESPGKIVKDEGLGKVSGSDKLAEVVNEVILENEKAVDDYKSGNKIVLNFLMGKVMQKMRGAAESKTVIALLREKLD